MSDQSAAQRAGTHSSSKPQSRARLSMERATSYDEWLAAAIARDERSGAGRWKEQDASSRYDYRIIRRRLDELQALRRDGDPHALLFCLNEGIHGNMGGIGSSAMYGKAKSGTKNLITEYLRTTAGAIRQVAATPDDVIPFLEKLEFFRRASLCFGRSALMLSGGGALGPFHVGVVKALHEQGLLPEVISGASAGSIVAAVVGTQSDETLTQLFDAKNLARAFQDFGDEGVETLKPNQRMSVDNVRSVIESLIPDMTFAEAFEATGRKINVSVSPREVHQKSRLLNAVTSPNVLIREAVLASCAVPGIYPPVTLAARNAAGERVPYVPSRQWVDGSVTDDLPAKRLSRLYGANHFITSQTNPVVLWRITDPDSDDLLVRGWNIYQNAMKQWFRATYPFAVAATKNLYPLNLITRMTYSVAVQDYTADINILPRRRFWDPRKLLSALDEHDTRYLIREGELATWPRIEMIRNCTEVSRALDAVLDPLETRYANQRAVLHAV